MTIDDIKNTMDESGKIGGSLYLGGCTGITALPDTVRVGNVIR